MGTLIRRLLLTLGTRIRIPPRGPVENAASVSCGFLFTFHRYGAFLPGLRLAVWSLPLATVFYESYLVELRNYSASHRRYGVPDSVYEAQLS